MNLHPVLSIHVLTFNSENYIKNTLESILKQETNFSYEIVIGDDCSSDSTNEIIKTYIHQYPNLINYKKNKKQVGILKNFKATLDRCQGEYVFDIAGDDLLKHSYSIQKMVDAFRLNPGLGFVDSGFDRYYEKKQKYRCFTNKASILCNKESYKLNILKGKVLPIGVCYNRKALYDFVDFDFYIKENITFEDYPILVDLVMNSDFYRINESLHIYRVHSESISKIQDFEIQMKLKTQMLLLIEHFTNKYKLPNHILNNYQKEFYLAKLYLAGLFGNKKLGKEMYLKLNKPKHLKHIAYYISSQNKLFRYLIRHFRAM